MGTPEDVAADKIREKIAKILWEERWKGIPYDTKGIDRLSEQEWDWERQHLRNIADQILSYLHEQGYRQPPSEPRKEE